MFEIFVSNSVRSRKMFCVGRCGDRKGDGSAGVGGWGGLRGQEKRGCKRDGEGGGVIAVGWVGTWRAGAMGDDGMCGMWAWGAWGRLDGMACVEGGRGAGVG